MNWSSGKRKERKMNEHEIAPEIPWSSPGGGMILRAKRLASEALKMQVIPTEI